MARRCLRLGIIAAIVRRQRKKPGKAAGSTPG